MMHRLPQSAGELTTMKTNLLNILQSYKFAIATFTILLLAGGLSAQAQTSYTGTASTGLWFSSRWNNASDASPYTSAFTANNSASFAAGNYTFTGGGTGNIGNITLANGANVTFSAASGTLGTGGNVRTLNIGTGSILNFAGNSISAAAGVGFVKSGAGVLALGGNTYTGGFTLNAGTIIVAGVNALGTGTLTLNGGTVAANSSAKDLSGKASGITIGGNVQFGELASNVSLAGDTSNLTFNATVSLGGAERTLTVGNNGNHTFAGVISNGGLVISKVSTATGRFVLSAANTYTGNTTISGGTLALSGSGRIASSPNITIASGAGFDVSGTTSGTALAATQNITASATGANTTGTITVASSKNCTLGGASSRLTFSAYGGGATAPLTVAGATAGALALNSTPVTVTTTSALVAGNYTLIAKSGSATGVSGAPGALTVGGSGLAASTTGSLAVASGNLILTVATASPTISTSGTPAALSSTYGTASSNTTFTVSGSNMSAGILVTPPSGFEVSTGGVSYSSTVTVGAAGTIASTTVYLRLAATATAGTKSGNIVLSSSGASSVNVATTSSTIATRALTITANSTSKVFNNAIVTPATGQTTFTSSGLQNGETIGSVTLTYAGGYNATDSAGNYTITPSAATGGNFTASNYALTYANGTLTVTAIVPSAPTITAITPGAAQLSVAFTAPASTGGSAITNYQYSTDGGSTFTTRSPAATTSPLDITGLTNGQSYNVQIRAVNAAGNGTATASTSGTPAAPSGTLSTSGTLSAFSATYPAASAQQSFSVNGTGLTGSLTVTPPAGFEVSLTSGSGFGSTATISANGTLSSTTVYVRLAASTNAASYSGNVTVSGGSAATQNVAATGTVSKATPTVSVAPTASAINYGQTLASSTLTSGTASVNGTFAFTTPATAPSVGTASQNVTFTPTDSTNYNTASTTASVTVNKATPTVSVAPTASGITYGQTLASSTLSGGTASVAGTYAFTNNATAPSVGTASQPVTFTPTDTANYNTASTTASVTVSKATPTVSVAPTASGITYGQTLASSTLSGGTASVAGTFAFTTSATAPAVGTASQSVTFTPTDGSNYNTASTTASVTVNKATPTLVFNSANSTTVNGTVTLNATSASTGAVTYTSSNNAVVSIASGVATGVAVGTATITASQAADSNYNAATANQTMTVTAAPVVLATYDFVGLVGNETTASSNSTNANLSSSTISRGAGLTASGNGQRYNATSWALTSIANAVTGNDYMEFTITPNSGYQFSVSSILVQWARSNSGNTQIALRSSVDSYASDLDTAKSVTDNESAQTFTWTFAQSASASPVTYRFYSYAEGTTGTGGPGDGSGNDIVVTGTITQLPPTATAATINGTVGTPLSANITATNSPTGYAISSGTLPAGLSLNGTTGLISGTPTTAGNGTIVAVTATNGGGTSAAANLTFNIAQGSQTITFGALSAKTYGDSTFSLTATASSGLSVSYASSNTSVATVAGSTVTVVGVGSTTITASQAGNGNYTAAANVTQTLTVGAKSLTGTFTANDKTYDGTTSATVATRAVTGKVGADDVNHTGGTATFANAAVGNGKTVTLAGATLTGAAASKYSLGSVSTTTANITQATPTISVAPTASAITYGQALSASTITPGTASVAGTYAFASPATTPAVGTASQSITFTPTDSGNYTTASTSASVTVNQAALAITGIAIGNKTYDGTTSATITGTAAYSGLVLGQSFGVTGTGSATFGNATVGSNKPVTVTGYTAPNGNYSLTQPTGLTGNITAKPLTITGLTGDNKAYDGNTTATANGTAALSGVEPGDTVTLTGTPTFTFASANVGTGISITTTGYTLGGASAGNYSLTQPTLSANITAATGQFDFAPHDGVATSLAYNGTAIPNVTVSAITYVGVTPGNNDPNLQGQWPLTGTPNASGAANADLVGTPNTGAYYQFTLTADAGYILSNPKLRFNVGRELNGPRQFQWRSSVDGFANPITATRAIDPVSPLPGTEIFGNEFRVDDVNYFGSDVITPTNYNEVSLTTTNRSAITFRFYAYGAESTNTGARLTQFLNFLLDVTQSSTAVPSAPVITGITANNNQLRIAFTAPSGTVTGYEYSLDGGSTWTATSPAIPTSPLVINGLTNGQVYPVQLRASNANGTGDASPSTNGTPQPNTITGLAATDTRTVNGGSYALGATASSGLTVSYASSNTGVATVAGNTVTIVGAGTTTITASQAGDADFAAAANVTQTLTVLPTGWTLVENFEARSAGDLNAQNNWSVVVGAANGTGTTTVTADPADAGNKVATLSGNHTAANRYLTSLSATETFTVFKRFRLENIDTSITSSGESHLNMGVSNFAAPSGAGDFTLHTSVTPTVTTPFRIREISETAPTNVTVTSDIWYSSWYVVNNSTGKFKLYVQGGSQTSPVLAVDGTVTDGNWTFRNSGAVTAARIYFRSLASHNAPAYVDDIYFAAGENLAAPVPSLYTTGTLAALTTTYGTASSTTSFTVAGDSLTAGITVTAPTGFEVSATAGSGYGSSIVVGAAGNVASTTVYVRLAATATAGEKSGNIVLSSSGAANIPIATTASTVSPKALTGTFTSHNKTYDGTTAATVATRDVTGKVGADDVTHTGGEATFDTADSGNGKTVTLAGATLTGAAAANYSLDAVSTATANITEADLTITGLSISDKTYDGNTSATLVGTAAYSGLVNGESFGVSGSPTATFDDAAADTAKPVTVTGYTAPNGNYSISQPTGLTGNITTASQTLTRATFTATHTRVMGGNYAVSVTASPAGGTVVYASSNSSVATVAGSTITVVGAGNATITASQSDGNYTATPLTQSLTILPTAWTLIENFNGLGTGGINGTGGWTANASVASVAVDPAEASNQCLQVAGNNTYAFKSLATTGNQTATLFLRFRIGHIDTVGNSTAGETLAAMGVSHVPTPTVFGNFTAQWGINPAFGTTNATGGDPGAPFHLVSSNSSTSYHNGPNPNRFLAQQPGGGQWYHAWAVINSTTGNYSLHLGGGAFGNRTLLTEWNITGNSTAGASVFPFRTSGTNNGTISETEALKVFLRSGASNLSTLHVDDIYFASGENLTLPFPELSRATISAADGFTVNWSPVDNAVNYTVLHSASKNMSDAVLATTASTSLALSSLSPGLRYVQVRANFANGTNATSAKQVNQLKSLAAGTTTYASVPGVLRSVGNAALASFLQQGNNTVTFTPYSANSTIAEIFGSSNEAGLAQGSTDSAATTILLLNSNGSTANTIFYDTDVNEWREGASDMGSTAIVAGKAFMLRNNTGSTDYFLLVGTLRDSQPAVSLSSAGNFTLLTTGRTSNTTLTDLNLNPGTGAGQFKAAAKPSGGDRLIVPPVVSTDPVTTYWYDTGSGQWYDGLSPVPSASIPAGQGFFIKRATDSTFSTWTMPAE